MQKQIITGTGRKPRKADAVLLKKIRRLLLLETVFVLANLFICMKAGSYFFSTCSIFNVISVFIRTIILFKITAKEGAEKLFLSKDKVYAVPITGSIVLAVAALGVFTAGGLLFFLRDRQPDRLSAVLILTFSVIELSALLYSQIIMITYTGVFFPFIRYINYSASLIVFALFVGVTLTMAENRSELVGLSGIVLGGSAGGLAGYQLWKSLLANENNRRLYHHFRNNSTIIFTRLSLKKDMVVVLGKIILSCITLSGFMLANALYSVGMGAARYSAIRAQNKERYQQIRSYFEIGAAIFGASLCYMVYSFKTFSRDGFLRFDMTIALIIALYTFTEFYFIIRDYIKARKTHNLISEEIKLIGLSSTMICLVLTQVAIMSFAHDGDSTFYNRLSGVIFGSVSAFIGIYMMMRARYLKRH